MGQFYFGDWSEGVCQDSIGADTAKLAPKKLSRLTSSSSAAWAWARALQGRRTQARGILAFARLSKHGASSEGKRARS